MRQGQNSKRSRGRGTGRRTNNVPTRHQTFDSNGPSIRIRGNAYQVHEKYLTLARDATAAGDRIAAENFLQHAEHYFRIINADGEGDGRNRGNLQRADQLQREFSSDGDGEGDGENDSGEAVVEMVAPPPSGNGNEGREVAGEGEQPVVEYPNGEDAAEHVAAPTKGRGPRGPRTPRAPRGRGRQPAGDSDSAGEQPSQPED